MNNPKNINVEKNYFYNFYNVDSSRQKLSDCQRLIDLYHQMCVTSRSTPPLEPPVLTIERSLPILSECLVPNQTSASAINNSVISSMSVMKERIIGAQRNEIKKPEELSILEESSLSQKALQSLQPDYLNARDRFRDQFEDRFRDQCSVEYNNISKKREIESISRKREIDSIFRKREIDLIQYKTYDYICKTTEDLRKRYTEIYFISQNLQLPLSYDDHLNNQQCAIDKACRKCFHDGVMYIYSYKWKGFRFKRDLFICIDFSLIIRVLWFIIVPTFYKVLYFSKPLYSLKTGIRSVPLSFRRKTIKPLQALPDFNYSSNRLLQNGVLKSADLVTNFLGNYTYSSLQARFLKNPVRLKAAPVDTVIRSETDVPFNFNNSNALPLDYNVPVAKVFGLGNWVLENIVNSEYNFISTQELYSRYQSDKLNGTRVTEDYFYKNIGEHIKAYSLKGHKVRTAEGRGFVGVAFKSDTVKPSRQSII